MSTAISIPPRRYSLLAFFLLAFVISWIGWVPAAAASWGVFPWQLPPMLTGLFGAFGPSLAAIILTITIDGAPGLRRLLWRLLWWRAGIKWYAFVLVFPAAISLASSALYISFGGAAPDFADPPVLHLYPLPPELSGVGAWTLLPFVFLQTLLFSSPMGEEIGWRGYALPRLQASRSALLASLILGLIWGLWHLPLFLMRGHPLSHEFFGWFLLSIVADAILFTWVYNNTRGSLLLALLFHASFSVTGLFVATAETTPLVSLALKWGVVVVVIAMAGPVRLSHRPTT
jgi:membrane protease YdiL (CAAX protease family)